MRPLSERLQEMAESNMWRMQDVSDLLEEAGRLAKRVEGAPKAEFLDDGGNMPVLRRHQMGLWHLVGQRVAIVPVDAEVGDGRD